MFVAVNRLVLVVELEDLIVVDAGGDAALEVLEVVEFLRLEIKGLREKRGTQ